jgi:cell wall-associated NlpC family hydrolase
MISRKFLILITFWLMISSPAVGFESSESLEIRPSLLDRTGTLVQDVILKGLELVGVPYRWGGTNPDAGLDCSGFVQRVFLDSLGVLLPRTSREMSAVGNRITRTELQPGDLVFFNTLRRTFSHVGIYLGDNKFLHSPSKGGEVRVDDMNQNYWVKRFNGARRVLTES